jgi:hypothetical protein
MRIFTVKWMLMKPALLGILLLVTFWPIGPSFAYEESAKLNELTPGLQEDTTGLCYNWLIEYAHTREI